MNDAIIDKVVARVMALAAGETISTAPRQVVMLFSGARMGTEAGLEAIRRLTASGHHLTVVRTQAATTITPEDQLRAAGATEIRDAGPMLDLTDLLRRADLLLIPTLTTRFAAVLALGFMDTAAATLVLRFLLAGKSVIAIKDAAEPDGHIAQKYYLSRPEAAPALRAVLNGHLATLESFGMDLVCEDGFLLRMERKLITGPTASALAAAAPASAPTAAPCIRLGEGQSIVTANELTHFAKDTTIMLSPGTRLTPQAEDTAKYLGLRLQYA